MSDLILYNYFRSSTSYRVRIALHLKNLPFEYRAIHLLKNEQNSVEYKRLNPQGEVPALVHDGKVISQSLAILEYLDEVFGGPRLYPADAVKRAHVRQFCENINAFLHPVTNLKVLKELEARNGYGPAQKEQWIHHWFGVGLPVLEKMAQENGGTYVFGDQITAADLCLVPALFSARRFNVNLDPYPVIRRIDRTCQEHPAFAKAHPLKQPDTPAQT